MMSWLMASTLFAMTATAWAQSTDDDNNDDDTEEGTLALPFDAPVPAPAPAPAPARPPASVNGRPLAIPGGAPRQPPQTAQPQQQSPQAVQDNAATLQALLQYRRERLEVRPEVEVSGGGARMQTGIGFGGPYWGTTWMVADPIRTTRTWGVYQGSERLDVPTFLGAAQQLDLKRQIEQDIERYDRRGRALLTAGVVGLATSVVGSIGARSSPPYSLQQAQFASVVFPGLAVGAGGLILGSVPASRADQLMHSPGEAMTIGEAQRLADAHNERLRVSLGLSPEDVWPLEAERAP